MQENTSWRFEIQSSSSCSLSIFLSSAPAPASYRQCQANPLLLSLLLHRSQTRSTCAGPCLPPGDRGAGAGERGGDEREEKVRDEGDGYTECIQKRKENAVSAPAPPPPPPPPDDDDDDDDDDGDDGDGDDDHDDHDDDDDDDDDHESAS
eukprot:762430-Hanusia_phi.AAC.1